GRARQAVPDRSAPALDRSHAVIAFEAAVRPTEQAVELPGELFWIDTGLDLACCLGFADGTLQAVRPVVLFLQHWIAAGPRPTAVQLLRHRPAKTAAWEDAPLEVGQPRVAHGPDPAETARY